MSSAFGPRSLLDLPAEMRIEIYKYLFVQRDLSKRTGQFSSVQILWVEENSNRDPQGLHTDQS